MLGCKPTGRATEQHDVFFGIGPNLKSLVPEIIASWPHAKDLHIDSWREVTQVNGFTISIIPRKKTSTHTFKLFFINLGGYKVNDLEEFHYKILSVAENLSEALRETKQCAFYLHTGFRGAESHVDDKYGIDVDDSYNVEDLLNSDTKKKFAIHVSHQLSGIEDQLHSGYLKLGKII